MIKPPLKWHGGKFYLADKIISMMPKHIHYVEPYFGGGQVLFRKDPEGVSEVINDIDGELMHFWRVLSDEEWSPEFIRRLSCEPFADERFQEASDFVEQGKELGDDEIDPVDRAVAFFIKYRQSRQGLGKCFATLSRNRTRRGMNEQVSSWLTAIEGLPEAHARLQRVVLLSRDAIDVILSQDGPNTLFYLDPPYLHETRSTTGDYEHEMSRNDHLHLLAAMRTMKGRFILSGYPSELYDGVAKIRGWHHVDIEIDNKASSAKTKEIKTERLWTNF
tara:strand:+ start:5455 stop:6282 length:828 start_codon:yes stop_codon:yes gene_type:complete